MNKRRKNILKINITFPIAKEFKAKDYKKERISYRTL